jgi:hypothetical protein
MFHTGIKIEITMEDDVFKVILSHEDSSITEIDVEDIKTLK